MSFYQYIFHCRLTLTIIKFHESEFGDGLYESLKPSGVSSNKTVNYGAVAVFF